MRKIINTKTGEVSDAPDAPAFVSPEEAALHEARIAKATEITQAKSAARDDTFVQSFAKMTTPQVRAHVRTATVGLPEPARELLEKMALLLHVDAKEKYL